MPPDPGSFTDAELMRGPCRIGCATVMKVTAAWVRALQTEPRLWLRARRGQGRALAEKLGDCRIFGAGPLADTWSTAAATTCSARVSFTQASLKLQDLSSQAVGLICDPRPGETWWDACAGEGGKTLHLSGLMANKGLIWASDRAAWRLAN